MIDGLVINFEAKQGSWKDSLYSFWENYLKLNWKSVKSFLGKIGFMQVTLQNPKKQSYDSKPD